MQSLLLQIRRHERETGEAGMTRSDIINWYLEVLEGADLIDSEEQLVYHRKLIKSVLGRLVKKENILLEIRDTTRLTEESETIDDPVLAINPAHFME